jgi:phage terminase large subunit GpA-like protein
MDCLSPSHPAERVVLMCASQMMKTEILINFVGFIIDADPGPILVVEPREEDAKTLSKDRIAPMLRDTPQLQGKVAETRSRDSGNTTLHKSFIGGHVTLVGAISPSGLAMRPIRYCLLDECDRYPASAGTEGDPVMLAIRRTDEFAWNKKILMASTPTLEGESRITLAYDESDQRKPYVPCPLCGEMQVLYFTGLEWPTGKPQEAQYRCGACRELIPHHRKAWMLQHGEWQATNPSSKTPGFWISQMYSTRRSWGAIAEEFIEASKSQESLKVFVNTVLAETWKERGEAPEWKRLHDRCENYALGTVPMGGLLLTAGVDVQKDRLEGVVKAWGRNFQNWVVDRYVLTGDTSREEVWHQLKEKLYVTYEHASGAQMSIVSMAVDSGYETQAVYRWARRMADNRIMVVRGSSNSVSSVPVSAPTAVDVNVNGKKIKRGLKICVIGVNHFKAELYGWLRQERPAADEAPPIGWSHFPQLEEEYFKQLTAEQLVTRINRNRYRIHEWVKTRERNEALDTAVYARAAAAKIGLDRYTERNWAALEQTLQSTVPELVEPAAEPSLDAPPAIVPMILPKTGPASPVPAPQRSKPYRPVRSKWMGR